MGKILKLDNLDFWKESNWNALYINVNITLQFHISVWNFYIQATNL